MKKSFWFKIITIIIIQAILLTQAEFAVASICSSKDLCQEAALTYQKITTKTISLIFGIGCLQLNAKSLQLEKLFNQLTGNSLRLGENLSETKLRSVSKEIYKVFALSLIGAYEYNNKFAVLISNKTLVALNWLAITQEARGPPMIAKNIESDFFSRIV
ncbi:MAG: hypothetical protein V1747_01485 [Candidatus Omnitrophota bacterium]